MIKISSDTILHVSVINSSFYQLGVDNKTLMNYPEESHRASAIESPVCDIGLTGEIFGVFYRRDHSFHREKSRQIRRVRRDDDQGEEPPYAAHDTRARGLMKKNCFL